VLKPDAELLLNQQISLSRPHVSRKTNKQTKVQCIFLLVNIKTMKKLKPLKAELVLIKHSSTGIHFKSSKTT
jgi:hypothetical protein